MIPWEKRPIEVANLFNPAFCGEILRRCIGAYQKGSNQPMPYPLAFLILPIILHRKTREDISFHQRLSLHAWIQIHQDAKIGFAERTVEFVPITKEAMLFLLQVDALTLDKEGGVSIVAYKGRAIEGQNEGEIRDCYRKADLIGRLLAHGGSVATIYTMWGVRP